MSNGKRENKKKAKTITLEIGERDRSVRRLLLELDPAERGALVRRAVPRAPPPRLRQGARLPLLAGQGAPGRGLRRTRRQVCHLDTHTDKWIDIWR